MNRQRTPLHSTPLQPTSQSLPTSQAKRIRYRIQQFLSGINAGVDTDEQAAAMTWLPEQAQPLFAAMPLDARRHSLNVLATLLAAGYDDPDLCAAALLHDMGKVAAQEAGVGINLWVRGPMVVAEALAPDFLRAQARTEQNTGWRYAVHVQLEHPAIGAQRARAAGCSELTCWLIAAHQDSAPSCDTDRDKDRDTGRDEVDLDAAETTEYRRQLLAALQWADGLN